MVHVMVGNIHATYEIQGIYIYIYILAVECACCFPMLQSLVYSGADNSKYHFC